MGTEEKNTDKIQNEMQENKGELEFIIGRNIDADLEEIEKVLTDRYQAFD